MSSGLGSNKAVFYQTPPPLAICCVQQNSMSRGLVALVYHFLAPACTYPPTHLAVVALTLCTKTNCLTIRSLSFFVPAFRDIQISMEYLADDNFDCRQYFMGKPIYIKIWPDVTRCETFDLTTNFFVPASQFNVLNKSDKWKRGSFKVGRNQDLFPFCTAAHPNNAPENNFHYLTVVLQCSKANL